MLQVRRDGGGSLLGNEIRERPAMEIKQKGIVADQIAGVTDLVIKMWEKVGFRDALHLNVDCLVRMMRW